jgi:hypothetical protein
MNKNYDYSIIEDSHTFAKLQQSFCFYSTKIINTSFFTLKLFIFSLFQSVITTTIFFSSLSNTTIKTIKEKKKEKIEKKKRKRKRKRKERRKSMI